jgi:hypothetical protein
MNRFEKKFNAKYGADGKSFVQEWVNRLESGNIKRVKCVLNNGKGMCCLGVACDIMAEDGLSVKRVPKNDIVRYDNEPSMPIVSIRRVIETVLNLHTTCSSLAQHNDAGRTFKKTAAVIRTAMKKQGIILE